MVTVKCGICKKVIKRGQAAVRAMVEIVTSSEDGGEDATLWSTVESWEQVSIAHLDCAIEMTNRGVAFEHSIEYNELALEDVQDELDMRKPYRPPLLLVEGGRG